MAGISSSGWRLKNSGWKLELAWEFLLLPGLAGTLGGGWDGRGGLPVTLPGTLRSVRESADLRGFGARGFPAFPAPSSSPSILLRAVSDLARWMFSTVGGVMCLDWRPWPALFLVNIFLCRGGLRSGVES